MNKIVIIILLVLVGAGGAVYLYRGDVIQDKQDITETDEEEVEAKTGTISGRVTMGPTCPVERVPPEPGCAPKPLATSINIREVGKQKISKTIQSDSSGAFKTALSVGSYELETFNNNGAILPRCEKVTVLVKEDQNSIVDISCDTGIR